MVITEERGPKHLPQPRQVQKYCQYQKNKRENMSEKVSPEMKAGTISKGLSTQMMYIQRLYNFFFNLGMIPPHAGIVLRIGIWNKVA